MLFIKPTFQALLCFVVFLYSITVPALDTQNIPGTTSTNNTINNINHTPGNPVLGSEIAKELPDYKYYDVEVILFRQNNDYAIHSEYWPIVNEDTQIINGIQTDNNRVLPTENNQSVNNLKNIDEIKNITGFQAIEGFSAIEDTQIDNSQIAFINSKMLLANYFVKEKQFTSLNNRVNPIDTEQLLLNKQAKHLKYSRNYQLLAHFGWRQPGFSKEQALPIQFIFDPESTQISGEIKIILSRYLHAKVNFNLHKEVCRIVVQKEIQEADTDKIDKVKIEVQLNQQQNKEKLPEQNISTEGKTEKAAVKTICREENIQFKQSRKMRSRELHYLDHPVFGLLIQITPSKMPIEQAKP